MGEERSFHFEESPQISGKQKTKNAVCDPQNTEERSFEEEITWILSVFMFQTLPAAASTSPILLPELPQ